jgi:hypothetical protein
MLKLKFSLRLAPERIVEMASMLPLNIYEIATECKPQNYLLSLSEAADNKDFKVHRIDFNEHKSVKDAFQHDAILGLIHDEFDINEPRLFIFENVDALAPLNQVLTYTLRTIITTRYDAIELFVFTALHENLRAIFYDSEAPFYLSSSRIYDYK